jgi:Ala-tRNA(Pro) deacylase
MLRRLVVPLDGSRLAETVLPHVRRLAADASLAVVLLRVGSLPPVIEDEPPIILDDSAAAEERQLGLYLQEQAPRLATSGASVQTRVRLGDPASEIVRCAEEEQADAIAMSTHGHTGLERLLQGSVAAAVLRAARRPLLFIRPAAGAFTPCKDRLEAYLRDEQVSFQIQHHPVAYTAQEIAASEHIPGRMLAKAVIVVADDQLVLLALPADSRVDLVKAAAVLGVQAVRLAREEEFEAVFPDCAVGAMPPFGNLYGLPVYVDKTLAEYDTIAVQAGSYTDTISLRYADFERLVQPTVAGFAHHL